MDLLIIISAFTLILVGMAGSVLPAIPGPPIAWLSLPLLRLHSDMALHPSSTTLWITALGVLLISILDYYLPIWGTRKFGGTEAGKRGSIIGLILGLFVPVFGPLTILLGPFVGAVAGELLAGSDQQTAWRSGIGTFIGFIAGTLIKLAICVWILIQMIGLLWK